MSLKIDAAVYNHIGGRKNNEDNFYLNGLYMEREQMNRGGEFHKTYAGAVQLYAVCDGMGGAEFGEEASLCTVQALKKYQETCARPDGSDNLRQMLNETSKQVDQISLSRNMPSGASGSTIAMLVFNDWFFRAVHVGDSRIYRLRNGALERLTKDHSEVQRLVDSGQITPDQAWRHPRKNVITRHLGMPLHGKPLEPTISERMELRPGDRYLICSDGLNDVVRDHQIEGMLRGAGEASQIASALVREALSAARALDVDSDNITAIVLDVRSVGRRQSVVARVKRLRTLRKLFAVLLAVFAGGAAWVSCDIIRFLLKK
ncbi:MAG: PP2C family protein-serine/threonine phosphatase [Candidatus Faecivicinus sp.]